MIRALVVKELREVLGIVVAGLALYLLLVASLTGVRPFAHWVPLGRGGWPFQEETVLPPFAAVGVLLALALGFRQSAWEGGQGTYLFLLHRPVRREVIFLTKLAAGVAVFLLCTGGPALLYVWWAAELGQAAAPFEWSMTAALWRLCLLMPLLYLGAFLSGLRPARWYGTRLLPLAACAVFVIRLMVMPWWWPFSLPLTAVLYGLLVAGICYVARARDYA